MHNSENVPLYENEQKVNGTGLRANSMWNYLAASAWGERMARLLTHVHAYNEKITNLTRVRYLDNFFFEPKYVPFVTGSDVISVPPCVTMFESDNSECVFNETTDGIL